MICFLLITHRIPNRKLATETSSNNQHRKWNHLPRFGNRSMFVRLLQSYTGRRARRCSRSQWSAATSSDSLTTECSRISPATQMVSTADRGLKATALLTQDLKKEIGTCSLRYCYFVHVQCSGSGWNPPGRRLELPLALCQEDWHCRCQRCSHWFWRDALRHIDWRRSWWLRSGHGTWWQQCHKQPQPLLQ